MAAGEATAGPTTVHVDVTNACNAACITCWDHSPLLETPRSPAWKRQALSFETFERLIGELDALGTVEAFILSGMGEPLTHPDIYRMIALVKARGWHLTMLSNLVAADIARLADSGVDQLLVGVHGATPVGYTAFHPGWTEQHFNTMCRYLRELSEAGVRCRHVQVINRDNAFELVEMVRFGRQFGAARVNFKLASLDRGTEASAITAEQRAWLTGEALPAARALARELGVETNLDLFERQLAAVDTGVFATTPMADIGCLMGYVYTRITVSGDVLYCCNTEVRVGSLADAPFAELWHGEAWQRLRERLRRGEFFRGCERCGKFEQNVKWSARLREAAGERAWRAAIGANVANALRLRVLS